MSTHFLCLILELCKGDIDFGSSRCEKTQVWMVWNYSINYFKKIIALMMWSHWVGYNTIVYKPWDYFHGATPHCKIHSFLFSIKSDRTRRAESGCIGQSARRVWNFRARGLFFENVMVFSYNVHFFFVLDLNDSYFNTYTFSLILTIRENEGWDF